MRHRSSRGIATGLIRTLAVMLLAAPALGVDIVMDVDAGSVSCDGIAAGVGDCDVSGQAPNQVTVTWSLSSAQGLNGYDLFVSWDPDELALVGSSQLYPDSLPPDTVAFLVAPDPLDPDESSVLTLSLANVSTTSLFSVTFDVVGTLSADCEADVWWSASGSGLSPGTVLLENPGGAGVDLAVARLCSDGLDNENDGFIDFDGGACAGLPPAEQTLPDPHCMSAIDNNEAGSSSGGCGLGPEVALVLAGLLGLRQRRGTRRRSG